MKMLTYLSSWHSKMTNITVFRNTNIWRVSIPCINNFLTVTNQVSGNIVEKETVKSCQTFTRTENFVTKEEEHGLVDEDCHSWRGDNSSQTTVQECWLGIKRRGFISNTGSCTPSCRDPPSSPSSSPSARRWSCRWHIHHNNSLGVLE